MAPSLVKRQSDGYDDDYDSYSSQRTTIIVIICVALALKIAILIGLCTWRRRKIKARHARGCHCYDDLNPCCTPWWYYGTNSQCRCPPQAAAPAPWQAGNTPYQPYGNPQYQREEQGGPEYPMTSYYGNPPQYEQPTEPSGLMAPFASKSGQYQPVARGRALSNEDMLGVQGLPSRDTSGERLVGQEPSRPLYG